MATIKKISHDELRLARKGKFKRKKPKKPKANATLTTYKNWVARYNAWVDDAKRAAKEYKELEKLKTQVRSHR